MESKKIWGNDDDFLIRIA